jgi:hypothetical protein
MDVDGWAWRTGGGRLPGALAEHGKATKRTLANPNNNNNNGGPWTVGQSNYKAKQQARFPDFSHKSVQISANQCTSFRFWNSVNEPQSSTYTPTRRLASNSKAEIKNRWDVCTSELVEWWSVVGIPLSCMEKKPCMTAAFKHHQKSTRWSNWACTLYQAHRAHQAKHQPLTLAWHSALQSVAI